MDSDSRKRPAALAMLAAATALILGINRDRIAALLGPTAQWIGKMAGEIGGAIAAVLSSPMQYLEKTAGEIGGAIAAVLSSPIQYLEKMANTVGEAAKSVLRQKERPERPNN